MLGLALAANWLRAFVTVYAGHLTQMRWGTGDEHLLLGWGLFGAVMLAAFVLARRFADVSPRPALIRGSAASNPPATAPIGAVLAGALAMTLAAGAARHLSEGVLDGVPREGFSRAAAGTLGPYEPVGAGAVPAYSGSRDAVRGRFEDGVEFALAYWAGQSAGAEMISHGNRLVPERAGIVALAETGVRLPPTDGDPRLDVRETLLRSGAGRVRSWWWFVADGEASASPLGAKLATLRGTLAGRGDHAALAWVAVAASDDAARDRATLAARSRTVQAFLAGYTGPRALPAEAAR
jgi:EpsI family protein